MLRDLYTSQLIIEIQHDKYVSYHKATIHYQSRITKSRICLQYDTWLSDIVISGGT